MGGAEHCAARCVVAQWQKLREQVMPVGAFVSQGGE